MPAFDHMTNDEVRALVAYLQAEIAHMQEHLTAALASNARRP